MEKFLTILGVIALLVILCLIMALPTMWLWNWLMPALFGIVKVNFWQALGINILSSILFKSHNWTGKKESETPYLYKM
jgi:hypothetical protein